MTRIALYARVSSGPQELSLDAQLRELREHAAREGLEVTAEVKDLAEKRHMLHRPGLDRVRELAASGEISEVWAVEFERFGDDQVPTLLSIESRGVVRGPRLRVAGGVPDPQRGRHEGGDLERLQAAGRALRGGRGGRVDAAPGARPGHRCVASY